MVPVDVEAYKNLYAVPAGSAVIFGSPAGVANAVRYVSAPDVGAVPVTLLLTFGEGVGEATLYPVKSDDTLFSG